MGIVWRCRQFASGYDPDVFRLTDDQLTTFAEAVRSAAGRDDLAGPLSAIYQSVADAVELNQPRCDASGACCRFDDFGHSLFVTTIEMAEFVRGLRDDQPRSEQPCPYQIDGQCSTHAIRPFGCRVFYCDTSAQAWQQKLYDRLHRQLRLLHEARGVPYFYVEWRQALDSVIARGRATSVAL